MKQKWSVDIARSPKGWVRSQVTRFAMIILFDSLPLLMTQTFIWSVSPGFDGSEIEECKRNYTVIGLSPVQA